MNIKPAVYENLSIRERIIASVEAQARGDEEEVKRLIATCPKRTYLMNDHGFADTMSMLASLAIAVECDLRGQAIAYLLAEQHERPSAIFLQNIANIRKGWHVALENLGINPCSMQLTLNQVDPVEDWFFTPLPDPDPARVDKYAKQMAEVLICPE